MYWPAERTLIVSDLHLEKASHFASQGLMLPPYDTVATLSTLTDVIKIYNPRRVIALGDNFHDSSGGSHISLESRDILLSLQRRREWIWITGNHDPDDIAAVGGRFVQFVQDRALNYRHQPLRTNAPTATDCHEIFGHFHPVGRVGTRPILRRRCFASTSCRLILPAFGSLAGGLNVRDPVFTKVLGEEFTVHLLGTERIFSMPSTACLPEGRGTSRRLRR